MTRAGTSDTRRSGPRPVNVQRTRTPKASIDTPAKCQPTASPVIRSAGALAATSRARSCGQPRSECAALLAIRTSPATMPRTVRIMSSSVRAFVMSAGDRLRAPRRRRVAVEELADDVALLGAVGARHHPVHELALGEGVRLAELVALDHEDAAPDAPHDLVADDPLDGDEHLLLAAARVAQARGDEEGMAIGKAGAEALARARVAGARARDVGRHGAARGVPLAGAGGGHPLVRRRVRRDVDRLLGPGGAPGTGERENGGGEEAAGSHTGQTRAPPRWQRGRSRPARAARHGRSPGPRAAAASPGERLARDSRRTMA